MESQAAQPSLRAGLHGTRVSSGRSSQKRLGLATWPASAEAMGQWLEGSVKKDAGEAVRQPPGLALPCWFCASFCVPTQPEWLPSNSSESGLSTVKYWKAENSFRPQRGV